MPASAQKTYTYADYAQLEEGAPYQLIQGDLVMTPAPTPFHQDVSGRLEYALRRYCDQNGGKYYHAPIDVYLSEINTFQPDIIYIAPERVNIIAEKKIEGAPDLVIEILSPSTAYYDLKTKRAVYESVGVREYWLVDPMEKSIELLALENGAFVLKSRLLAKGMVESTILKGFSADLQELFKP